MKIIFLMLAVIFTAGGQLMLNHDLGSITREIFTAEAFLFIGAVFMAEVWK